MKKVYVCSPLSAPTPEEVQANIDRAIKYCSKLSKSHVMPLSPCFYFTRFLDYSDPDQRGIGLKCGFQWISECLEVHVLSGYVSTEMYDELKYAHLLHIPVINISKEEEE